MKYSVGKLVTVAAAIAMVAGAVPALSARAPDNMVTGTVSGVSGNQIVVDGKSYSVKVTGPALRDLQRVQIGEAVDLVLNGAPQSSASQVVAIHVHAARQ